MPSLRCVGITLSEKHLQMDNQTTNFHVLVERLYHLLHFKIFISTLHHSKCWLATTTLTTPAFPGYFNVLYDTKNEIICLDDTGYLLVQLFTRSKY